MKKKELTALLVDDEVEIIEILADELGRRGVKCLSATNGKDALQLIESSKPDVIVSDFRMPHLNGMDLLEFLSDLKIRTPVIWLTAYAQQEAFREAWRLGVYDFYEKPFRATEIADHVIAAASLTAEELLERKPKFLNKGHFKQIEVDLEIELFERLKAYCLENSISLSRFIAESLSRKFNGSGM